MIQLKEVTCRRCGTTFTGHGRKWYCDECKEIRREETKADRAMRHPPVCSACGRDLSWRCKVYSKKMLCQECKTKRPPKVMTCVRCGKVFEIPAEKNYRKYCEGCRANRGAAVEKGSRSEAGGVS